MNKNSLGQNKEKRQLGKRKTIILVQLTWYVSFRICCQLGCSLFQRKTTYLSDDEWQFFSLTVINNENETDIIMLGSSKVFVLSPASVIHRGHSASAWGSYRQICPEILSVWNPPEDHCCSQCCYPKTERKCHHSAHTSLGDSWHVTDP